MDKKLKPLVLEGSPRERGKIHGEMLRAEINERLEVDRYSSSLFENSGSFDEFVDMFFQETEFIEAVKKWTPDLLEEVNGIAEGAGVDQNLIFLLQLGDEISRFHQYKGYNLVKPPSCSSIGCNRVANIPSMQGQNLDTSLDSRGFETILHIKERKNPIESLIIGRSGQIGYFGLNNSPLALNLNTINCNFSFDGLPLAFICRKILQLSSIDESVEFLKSIKHAVGQNFMIGDKERIVDYEASANEVSQFIPRKNYKYIYHTNHPLSNKDIIKGYKPSENTLSRYQFLDIRMGNSITPIELKNLQLILSSHFGPICAHYPENNGFVAQTWISNISVLSDNPELHIAVGYPCKNKFFKYSF